MFLFVLCLLVLMCVKVRFFFVCFSFGYYVQVSAFWIHMGEAYRSRLLESCSPSSIFIPPYSPFYFTFSRIEDNASLQVWGWGVGCCVYIDDPDFYIG